MSDPDDLFKPGREMLRVGKGMVRLIGESLERLEFRSIPPLGVISPGVEDSPGLRSGVAPGRGELLEVEPRDMMRVRRRGR